VKGGAEYLFRVSFDVRIAKRSDSSARAEDGYIDTEVCECLTEFDANHPGTDYGDFARQVIPFEHIVVDDCAITQCPIFLRNVWRRSRSDYDAACPHASVVAHLK
jgi:hypothetical protein